MLLLRFAFALCVILMCADCTAQEQEQAEQAAPKQVELNVHLPIPVEPWTLPPE